MRRSGLRMCGWCKRENVSAGGRVVDGAHVDWLSRLSCAVRVQTPSKGYSSLGGKVEGEKSKADRSRFGFSPSSVG